MFPGYHTRLILPYQLPASLIPLDPKVCISHYDRIKNYIINPDAEQPDTENSVTTHQPSVSTTTAGTSSKQSFNERRKKRRFIIKSNHPRKSPRQHASTLAILSSFINQRKKREKRSGGESDLSRSSLGPIPEEDSIPEAPISVVETPIPDEKVKEELSREVIDEEKLLENLAALQHVSEILSEPIELDISEEIDGVILKEKPDAIELLHSYNNVNASSYYLPGLSESTRTIKRKRKKNKTGWPKKKRLFTRRPGVKNGENSILPEEDSRFTEGSVEDNGEGDNVKDSDVEENEGSDAENRTLGEFEGNTDSVDSNCNVSDERKCEKVLDSAESDLNNSENVKNDTHLTNLVNSDIQESQIAPQEHLSKSEQLAKEVENPNAVNVDLNTWEKAEKVLHAKMANSDTKCGKILQPFVRVQKIDGTFVKGRLRSSSSPERKPKAKRAKLQPVSPRSPRKLRAPRGKWYRER